MIDILNLLQENDIQYWEQGKNTSQGWVNVHCPLPNCGDRSNHMGISLSAPHTYHCWNCGETGRLIDLLPDLLDCSPAVSREKLYEYQIPDEPVRAIKRRRKEEYRDILPKQISLGPMHKSYLHKRKFDYRHLTEKYKLFSGGVIGDWKFRIIIPVIEDGLVVQFSGMAIAGQDPKYKHCPNEKALKDMKSCLYGIDEVKDIAVVVEGATDQWRGGDGFVATFGTAFTDAQVNLLSKRVKKVYVMYDSDAVQKGYDLANQLSVVIPYVEIIELERGDPADMSAADIDILRKEIGLC